MCCPLVFEFSVGIGAFVIGLSQISFFFSYIPPASKISFYIFPYGIMLIFYCFNSRQVHYLVVAVYFARSWFEGF